MQMHIKCIFQFCRSPGRTGSGLFRFRSGSALATASYQHFIARKHTRVLRPSRQPSSGGAGAGSSWAAIRWPVDHLALHQLPLENLILKDVNPAGRCRPCSCCSSSRFHSPDIELGVNMGKCRPNYVAPHVVKPPTVD